MNIRSMCKTFLFLCTSKRHSENKMKINFIHNGIKINLGTNLTMEVSDLCTENYKTLLIEIKDLNKWRSHSKFKDYKTQSCKDSNSPHIDL